jgi:hypothetical protein
MYAFNDVLNVCSREFLDRSYFIPQIFDVGGAAWSDVPSRE